MRIGNRRGSRSFGDRGETFELVKAWLGTTLAFAIILTGIRFGPNLLQDLAGPGFVRGLIIAALTAGIGFVLHELGHRVVARHYGSQAHFRANDQMLIISIVIAFTGFLFAAPGAVYHSGYLTRRQSGLVAAAGPIVNMVLAVVFLLAFLALRRTAVPGIVLGGLLAGFQINGWLGLFNMLPFGPIDGAKVLEWNTAVFGVLFAVGVLLSFGIQRFLPGLF